MRNVQIPEDLFLDLVKWHCLEMQEPEREKRICDALEDKVARMAARQKYAEQLKTRNKE